MRVDIPTDYTYEDFLIDYGARYEKYKEKKTLFNILKAGKVMRQMSIEAGLLIMLFFFVCIMVLQIKQKHFL